MMSAEAQFLTKTQRDGILRAVVETHLAKLDRVAATAKLDPGFDAIEAERQDRIIGWAYRLLDAQGSNAVVRDVDRLEIRQAGLADDDIRLIEEHLLRLRFNGMVPTHHGKLSGLLAVQGAAPTAMNLAQAQNIYFRGLSLALFHSQARYQGAGIEDAEFVKTMLQQEVPDRVRGLSTSGPAPVVLAQAPNAPAPPVERSSVDDRIVTIGEGLIRVRGKDKRWDGKTQTQARQLYALMDRFLVEECNVPRVAALNQQHLAKFVAFLRHDIYKFYGRSSKDAQRSIEELRSLAAGKPEACRGIDGGTLNRHLTNIDQLLIHARAGARGGARCEDSGVAGEKSQPRPRTRSASETWAGRRGADISSHSIYRLRLLGSAA
jgi:hypothetical protein